MDHEAYEKEMIDTVNRHAEEQGVHFETGISQRAVITKKDTSTLKIGLKRMVLALFTAVLFALSIFSFIATATATGYWAVILFISAIVLLGWAFVLLYAQGIVNGGGRYVEK